MGAYQVWVLGSETKWKNEIVAIREMYALVTDEHVLHTAHRTTTSHAAWERLCRLLEAAGYKEKEDYISTKQFGLEKIKMINGDGEVAANKASTVTRLAQAIETQAQTAEECAETATNKAQEAEAQAERAKEYATSDYAAQAAIAEG